MENIILILGILFMFAMGFVSIKLLYPAKKKKKERRKKSRKR